MPVNLTTSGATRQIFRRFAGDSGPDLDLTLEGGGSLATLTKPSSEIIIWRRYFPFVSISGNQIAIISPTAGTVTVDIGSWLATSPVPGDWHVAVRAVFSGGDEFTFPWDVIRVETAG